MWLWSQVRYYSDMSSCKLVALSSTTYDFPTNSYRNRTGKWTKCLPREVMPPGIMSWFPALLRAALPLLIWKHRLSLHIYPPPPLQRWWARVRQVSVQCDVIEQTKLSRSFDWNLTRIFDAVQLRRSNACVRWPHDPAMQHASWWPHKGCSDFIIVARFTP